MKISACYIVKNEEKNLSKSIESLIKSVDELIIVDTGSTDQTIEIAKSFNAKIINYEWKDDFSEPRNLAIENAAGEWIIMIDADEYFIKPKKIRRAFKNFKSDAVFIPRIDIDTDHNNKPLNRDIYVRIFRNVDYLRYQGLIHENLENIKGGNFNYEVANDDLTIYHTGYSESKANDKLNRNLRIINKEIDQIGLQFRHHIALVDCYYALGDYAKALEHANKILETDLRPITGLNIFYRKTLNAMRQVNCSPEEIIKVANQAVDEIPNDYYFRLERGLMFYLTKQLDKAKVDLKIAVKSPDQDIKSLAKSSLKMIGLKAEG